MATVNIQSVSKTYDAKQAVLSDINLSIQKGEFLAIVGPSGCGKSTLLRLIAGLEKISSGSILINEQCVNTIKPSERDMAMVFQNYALYPHMTVFNNMAYGLKMRKIPALEIKRRVEETANMLKITEYLQRKPSDLSGGQRQRVAMGRAIVRAPAVYLFDEPLSNLDASLRTSMRHEIKKLHRKLQITSIYVTHDQTEAMTLADRIVILNKGKIEQVGTPYALYHAPVSRFVAGFTGHYPVNFISATIRLKKEKIETNLGIELPLPTFDCNVEEGQSVLIGIRAEHLFLAKPGALLGFTIAIDFIDALGADKLIHGYSSAGEELVARIAEEELIDEQQIKVTFSLNNALLFSTDTEQRIGRWNDAKKTGNQIA